MRANCGERGRCYRKCSQPRRSPQPSPFTHLALKTEAAEARNHAVLAANAGHTFFILAVEDRSQNDPQLTSTLKLPSASTLDQSTATVIILIHFAPHVRHCGAAREALWCRRKRTEGTQIDHPPTPRSTTTARRGHEEGHDLVGGHWELVGGHQRRGQRGNRGGRPSRVRRSACDGTLLRGTGALRSTWKNDEQL